MNDRDPRTMLADIGIRNVDAIYWNWSSAALVEVSLRRREAHLAHLGPLVVRTGVFTGRAANDKFIVDEPSSRDKIWWGEINRPFSEDRFDALYRRVCAPRLRGEMCSCRTAWQGPIRRMNCRFG